MNPATQISLCTVRIECYGEKTGSVGTGYLYFYNDPFDKEVLYPVIVTNKHVIFNAHTLKAEFHIIKQGDDVAEDGHALNEEKLPITIEDLQKQTILHPGPNIDLCVILLGTTLNGIKQGFGVKNVFLNKSWHIEPELEKIIRPIESVVMIGYPDGLWDEVNNRPITRRGLTASHPLRPWNGKREFVIDAACFHGSSGSPVFLYEDGVYRSNDGGLIAGTRAKLLGTLWGGPTVNSQGILVDAEVPSSVDVATPSEKKPILRTMMNLGYVVHASALDDFLPLILKFMTTTK